MSFSEIIRLLVAVVGAPVFYFAVGLPWAAATRTVWAPLWGIAVIGLAAEFSAMAGCPVLPVVGMVAGLHLLAAAVLGLLSWGKGIWKIQATVADFVFAYLLALVPLVAVPFPLPGDWGGDWLVALEAGRHLLSGERFTPELLARPPLFGAAAIPLMAFGPVAASFQVFCAVASAGLLQVFQTALGADRSRRWLWIPAGSIFFLQITANAWSKFLCAAFLLAAWQTLNGEQRWRHAVAGVLLGLALATHQSAVLFVPLLLTRLEWTSRRPAAGAHVMTIIVTAALMVLPWEIHTLASYGWKAKWLANPAVSQRLADLPAWLNALLVGVTTFVAWGPVEVARHWWSQDDRFSLLRLGHEAYWLATATFNTLAGCLLGLVLPWWTALGGRELARKAAAAVHQWDRRTVVALTFALLGQMILNPFYSADGSLQTGWVPFGVLAALWFAQEISRAAPSVAERVLRHTTWLSAAPWLAFNILLTAALAWFPWLRRNLIDHDLQSLRDHGWVSLAMGGFPWLQLLLAATCVLAVRSGRRLSNNSPEPVRAFGRAETA